MEDRTPKIFNYIRLMQDIPCIGRVVDGRIALDCNINLNDKVCYDVSDSFSEKIRFSKIELETDERNKARIERMIKKYVTEVEKPQYPDYPDLSHCKSWEEAIVELEELNKQIIAYRDYVETCNSLRFLYNLMTPYVRDYLQKCWLIAGTGHSVGFYTNITQYYNELKDCLNRVEKRCAKINIRVEGGFVKEVCITDSQRKNKIIPLLAKGSRDITFINLGIALQTSYIDNKHQWENVKKMSYCFEPDSEDCYSFDEIRSNVLDYLRTLLEKRITKRNTNAEILCKKMEPLYRYLKDVVCLSRNDAWTYICELWKSDNEIASLNSDKSRELMWRYLGNFEKLLPVEFAISR